MEQLELIGIKKKPSPTIKKLHPPKLHTTLYRSHKPCHPRKFYERICPTCHAEFNTQEFRKIYCSTICRPSNISQKGQRISLEHASAGNTGTFSELLVTTDLIACGFYVFRCVSPHAPFDLVALKDTTLIKIEVKTTTRTLKGLLITPKHSHNLHDVLACVIPSTREIIYLPPLIDILPPQPHQNFKTKQPLTLAP